MSKVMSKVGQCGSHLCCKIKKSCDVCNGAKDKPTQLRLRWESIGGAPTSVTFSADDLCVTRTTLTSGTDSNEVVLDSSSCSGYKSSGYKSKLPTNIYFKVDGSSDYLHASCSQALNLGDVLYSDPSKGFLVLVGFRALSGRTDSECSGSRPRSGNQCDICDGSDDKPQKLRLRWEGHAGKQSSVSFSSYSNCVEETALTSDSRANEVVLDATSCFYGRSLPSNIYFKVDGLTTYLHTSCSQPLYVGDVLYNDAQKGSLVLAGFEAMSGRTERTCLGGPDASQDQCTCDDPNQCFGDVRKQMRKQNYRLECESVNPKICEAVTRVQITPEDCSATAGGCTFTKGFKIDVCPCSGQCFDGDSCQSSKCPCNAIDCSDWSSRKSSFLDYIKKNECVCNGATPCLTQYARPKCDVCNLHKDKPQMLIFRWVGKVGSQTSIRFESEGTCGREQVLTSGSKSNEVVLEASCFQNHKKEKLPTDIYFKVDGLETSLHASCSQPLNIGDAVYTHPSKGSLIVVGFRSVTGRTANECPKAIHNCAPRSATAPSLKCDAGINLVNTKSAKGVNVRVNKDSTVQYMWNEARHGSISWDHFEYTALSCDGEKVNAKIIIKVNAPWLNPHVNPQVDKRVKPAAVNPMPNLERSWGHVRADVQCDVLAGEVMLRRSWTKADFVDECKETCERAPGCQSITFFGDGWCALFSSQCTKTSVKKKAVVAVLGVDDKPDCGEIVLKSSSGKVANADACSQSCMNTPGCKYAKFHQKGWCAHFGTSCTKLLNSNSNPDVALMQQQVERATDSSFLHGVGDVFGIVTIMHLFYTFVLP